MTIPETNKTSFGSGQIQYLKYLRSVATIIVVMLHVLYSGAGLNRGTISATQNLWTMLVVNASMYAVPLFVMVSGALLLDPSRDMSLRKIYQKYILRAVTALVIFGFIYRIFDMIMDGEDMCLSNLFYACYEIVTASGWSHLWYIYLLIGLYILLPFYRMIALHLSKNDAVYLCTVYLIFLSILPFVENYVPVGFYIHVSTIYPFYFFLGYLINKNIFNISFMSGVALFFGGLLVSLIATYFTNQHNIDTLSYFSGYSSISTVMQSIGLFSIFHNMSPSGNYLVNVIDRNSFGIYLIHMIFVRLILRYMSVNPYTSSPVETVIIYVCLIAGISIVSCAISQLLKILPAIKEII